MPSAPQSSITVLREMPSSTPRSGVRTTPSLTMKTLKPGPSATLPCGVDDAARVGAAVVGVEHRQHQVDPVVVLDRRVDRLGRDPHPLADVQVDARGLLLGRRDPDERQRVGVEAVGRQARIARAARRHAARADHRHVGVVEAAGLARSRAGSRAPRRAQYGIVMRILARLAKKRSRWSSRRKNAPCQALTTS